MTGNNNTDDDSNESLISRRAVIATLGAGTGGVGVAAKTGYLDLDSGGGSDLSGEDPPMNESAADPSTPEPTSVWNRDEVVVSIEQKESDSGGGTIDLAREETRNAVAEWNDYIAANEAFDLTLTYDENPDNADILFQLIVMEGCLGEYKVPARSNPDVDRTVCAETLTEEPSDDDLPLTSTIHPSGSGRATYRLITWHAIGRFLGYDIWSDPVDVMTPEILVKPTFDFGYETVIILQTPNEVFSDTVPRLAERINSNIDRLREPMRNENGLNNEDRQELAQTRLESFRDIFIEWRETSFRSTRISEWKQEVERLGIPHYLDAWEETVEAEELAFLNDTITFIDELINSDEDIVGTGDYETVIDRVETMTECPNSEPWDVRIHRYYGEAVWSAWENE